MRASRFSAAGCKINNVDIVYTPWDNLKKTGAMEIGQVGMPGECCPVLSCAVPKWELDNAPHKKICMLCCTLSCTDRDVSSTDLLPTWYGTQVGFNDPKRVLKVKVDRKTNEIINRLEKTRQELSPDFRAEKEAYMSQARAAKRIEEKTKRAEEKASKDENRRQKDLKEYKHIMKVRMMQARRHVSHFHHTLL